MDDVLSGAPAPAAPVAPAAEAAPAPDATAAPVTEAPEGGDKPDAPEKMLPQSEVNKILAKERAKEARRVERALRAEIRAEMAEKQLAELRQPPSDSKGSPQRKDFDSDEAYADAWVDYRVEQKIAERESKREKETSEQRQKRQSEERVHSLQEKMAAGREEYGEDFEERVLGANYITEPMVRFWEESDVAHRVMHELTTNVAEAARIAKLSPIAQIRELDKLEAKLKAPPTPTKAPPPIVPNGAKATVTKDPSKMTDKEFADWRKASIAQRR